MPRTSSRRKKGTTKKLSRKSNADNLTIKTVSLRVRDGKFDSSREMVAAGATSLMAAASESSSSKVVENITPQFEVQHAQQSSDTLVRRSTRSGSTDSIRKKDNVKLPTQKTACIRETKASRLRAASIVSPVDGPGLTRRSGFSETMSITNPQSSANFLNKQKSSITTSSSFSQLSTREKDKSLRRSNKLSESEGNDLTRAEKIEHRSKRLIRPNLISKTSSESSSSNQGALSVHRRHYDSKDSTRRVSSQQSTSDSAVHTSLTSSSGMKPSSTLRSGGHDSTTEVSQRVDALTALTRATMERVERLTSSTSSSIHAITPINTRSGVDDFHSLSVVASSKLRSTTKSSKTVCVTSSPSSSMPTTNSSSILKTINDEVQVCFSRHQPTPISILKHKMSFDVECDGGSRTPPVIPDDENITKKHGILKKRSSLDESEILRRRSYSPDVYVDVNSLEIRPIVMMERRSSLDELVKRPRSPDASHHLTSILKRKSSGEDDRDDIGSPEPQSILKRPSSSGGKSNLTGHHVSIAAAVAKTLGGTEFFNGGFCTEVRPILKKKMSREESLSSDPPSLEPRPILKKKSSTESDEHEERPKKTILKSSRKSSEDSSNESESTSPKKLSLLKNRALQRRTNSLPECDAVRPILKNSTSGRSRSSDFTPSDLCLRKRARSVGHEHTTKDDWTGMYDSSDTLLDVDRRPTSNSSRCNNFASSITPIVSFKLPSSDDEVVCSDSNIEDNFTDVNARKLDEGISKLRRARHLARRYRDRRAPVNAPDICEAVPNTVVIESVNDLELENSRVDQNVTRVEGQIRISDRKESAPQKALRFEATDQVNTSENENNRSQLKQHQRDIYDRFCTQPVTYQEVQEAVLQNQGANSSKTEILFPQTCGTNQETNRDDIDPSKLSLLERVRLFNRRIATESVAKVGVSLDRAQRRPLSRFRTQPVTSEEVEVAARSIPSRTTDLKRAPSETVVGTSTFEAVNHDVPKSILKFPTLHVREIRPQIPTEFVDPSDSSSDSSHETDPQVAHKSAYSDKQELLSVRHKDNKFENSIDVNDGVILRNKNRIRESGWMSVDDETTVPSEYIDSVNISTESALTRSTCMRQRIINSTNYSRSLSEGLATDIPKKAISITPNLSFPNMSIAERLAALQRSGTTDWKRRVTAEPVPSIIVAKSTDNHLETGDLCSKDKEELAIKQRRLAERLEKLESAAEGWRKRVAVTDALKFSVAGKMRVEQPDSFNLHPKPLFNSMGNCISDQKKKVPRPEQLKKEHSSDIASIFNDDLTDKTHLISLKDTCDDSGEESKMAQSYAIQYVSRADDETFTSFFESISADKCREESFDMTESDFDIITSYSELLGTKRTTKAQRRRVPSRNPLRTLAARTDLKDEYTEVITGVADRVMKMTNIDRLAQNSSLAVEALAGLASTEDFNLVTLRNIGDDVGLGGKLRPYKDLMLILVKGRRHVQVRLVEPVASSVNAGDNYILVTMTDLYHYVGKYSNVIEKARAAEIAMRIQKNRDLGCRASKIVTIGEHKVETSSQLQNFWSLLSETEVEPEVVEAGHPDEDELYESAMIATNIVYEIAGDVLVPVDKYWGAIPKIKMLDPSKILIFDFGSEMYIWNGKIATTEKRKIAMRLAQELWEEGYDYSECTASPIDAASMIGLRSTIQTGKKKQPKRPDWCLLGKITQHMETILFREKFLDWPNASGVIKVKKPEEKEQVDAKIIVEPPNVDSMIESKDSVVDFVLEGSHVGRGKGWFEEELNRQYTVVTTNVTVWHIDEYSSTLLSDNSKGQFCTGDSYIIRWMYNITVSGRELSGLPSKHAVEGRDRCAYFIWQGKKASLNKQGTAALLTVELDKEQGPQIRVVEGFEPAVFLNLFQGGMVVHSGKKSDASTTNLRTYICRGAEQLETSLIEVPVSPRQLRSRGSMIFVHKSGKIQVWHGRHSLSHVKQNALYAANKLRESCPEEAGLSVDKEVTVEEMYEGEEPAELVEEGMTRKLHMTLNRKGIPHHTPRLFHFSSVSGEFTANEIFCLHRSKVPTPFPFLQEELYQVSQPALFLLDNKEELWLWQGWWPDSGSEDQTGSGAIRWQAERRAAMTVAIQYWKKLHPGAKKCSVFLVWAGLEPREFINLFPTWADRDEIAELNIRDGRAPGEVLSAESELARLMKSTYPPAQLLQRPLPEGVDPTTLELYLSPQHFQELLGMNIEEFQELPSWKQIDIKKKIGLF